MRTSNYLLATEKETPNDAELISHQLMLRAGLIRKVAAGIYTWLPTGVRVLHKVMQIVREEMNRAGAVETLMPNILPRELTDEVGRWERFGPELLKMTDRHEREFCFGPTHEEIITDIARREIRSYKQLPINLYQIQTKFRDEIRPRFGVMRGREFVMKDAYSFHTTDTSLKETYQAMFNAYTRILERLGLEARAVIADSGAIGGETSHEFQVLAGAGEDDIFYSDQSDYAANVEKATALCNDKRPAPSAEIAEVDTPNITTIAALCELLSTAPQQTVKTMIGKNAEGQLFALILRGDHTLNEVKVANLEAMGGHFDMATETEIRSAMGASPGSLGPYNCELPIVVDHSAAALADFSCGANQDGKHLTGINWDRDITNYTIADIRNVVAGDLSPDGKGTLQHTKGIEVGHIFQLGTHYAEPMKANVLGENGKPVSLTMGCYGFGISRVIAAAIEQHHDARGIVWPQSMAPFQVAIVPIKYNESERVKKATDAFYSELNDMGVDVLLDDRKERPGVKFADIDLVGITHRVVISDKNLDNAQVEYKVRRSQESELLTQAQCLAQIQASLS